MNPKEEKALCAGVDKPGRFPGKLGLFQVGQVGPRKSHDLRNWQEGMSIAPCKDFQPGTTDWWRPPSVNLHHHSCSGRETEAQKRKGDSPRAVSQVVPPASSISPGQSPTLVKAQLQGQYPSHHQRMLHQCMLGFCSECAVLHSQ